MQQKAEAQTGQKNEAERDAPVLDLSDAAVKKMIKAAKTRGFVTYDELNAVLLGWGTVAETTGSSVPEPATALALLAMGTAALNRRR